jgi:hypothetical protein
MRTRSLAVLVCLSLTSALCTSLPAQQWGANLDGLQENPPVATPGNGTGTLTYNPVTQELTVDLSYSGLIAPTTDAHIHGGATSTATNAGVAIGFTGAGGFVTGSTSGTYNHTFDLSQASTYNASYFTASGGTVAQARDRLLAGFQNGLANNNEVFYFNIHTSFRPGGEIRGNVFPIPEPASAAAFGALMILTIARRERRNGLNH